MADTTIDGTSRGTEAAAHDPDAGPVRVGAMLFTLVDPHPGYEAAYNRWYERDHFYGGVMVGPGTLAGKRWVATRILKDLRFPVTPAGPSPVAEPLDAGSYLATYFIDAASVAEHFAWASEEVHKLYAADRGFEERRHAHRALHDAAGTPPRCRPDPRPPGARPSLRRAGVDSPRPREGSEHQGP